MNAMPWPQPIGATLRRPATVVTARLRDMPVGAAFRTTLTGRRGTVRFHFKWHDAVLVKLDDAHEADEFHRDVIVEVLPEALQH